MEATYYFFSNQHHRALQIFDKEGKVAEFINQGSNGYFQTEDAEIAEKLRKHKQFNKDFYESEDGRMPDLIDNLAHHGARTHSRDLSPDERRVFEASIRGEEQDKYSRKLNSAITEVTQKLSEENKSKIEKAMRYGELKGQLLNKAGEYRKDASQELIEEFEKLKQEVE